MQKLLFLLLSIFIIRATNARTAIISDPDGYCNIRQSASNQSKVIDTLSNDRIVFVFEEEVEGNWLSVDYKKGKETLSGYVHKSRITFLANLTNFKQVTHTDSMLKLQLDSIQVTITKGKFNIKGRQIQYDKLQGEQKFVKYIDRKFPWGTDGNIPIKEYKSIQFKSGDKALNFPPNTFKDLFEPNLNMTMACFDRTTGKFYIEAINSDGAGSYVVIWTLKDKQVIGRETFIPF